MENHKSRDTQNDVENIRCIKDSDKFTSNLHELQDNTSIDPMGEL